MINKKSIWFLTLFSLILVLSVYYITMPNDLLLTNVNTKTNSNKVEKNKEKSDKVSAEVSESTVLVALRVSAEEEYLDQLKTLKNILNDKKSTVEEKNNAFEQIKSLNNTKGEQEELEQKIEKEYSLKSFVKIDGDQIRVVVDSDKHDTVLANEIMRLVQSDYENKMYISVKFQTT
jgi:stage III sporulation protein AH